MQFLNDRVQKMVSALLARFKDFFEISPNCHDAFVAAISCPAIKLKFAAAMLETAPKWTEEKFKELFVQHAEKFTVNIPPSTSSARKDAKLFRFFDFGESAAVQDCKSAWRSLRDSYKYHIKASEKKRAKSGSAGGVGPQPPMANEAVEWHLAPYMAFLPELSMQRRTYCSALDDVPSTSQGIIPEGSNWDLQFEANASMDASQASYVEDGLDASNTSCENTSAYSYERASKRAKVDKTGSKEVFSQIHSLIDKQVEMLSVARSGALPAALYWSDIIRGFEPEMARRATNAVTQMLLNFENAITNNVTPQTSTFGPSEH
ncbi:hypothetical protein ACLKA7_007734 [Drosophila subpalustris]